ncbi:hypothetical protein BZA70DRAFT_181388 [Myxozyma melibiosi]|uniref:Uncharacterized protein n=1 Tax=Myxozyma melibiosi TaxID=54550 RepID=A0ABR1F4D0_9ASCO
MAYQVYSNLRLSRFLHAASECAHTIVLLEAIVERAETDADYIADFSVEKRDRLCRLLRTRRYSISIAFSQILRVWQTSSSSSSGTTLKPQTNAAIHPRATFDYIFESCQAVYKSSGLSPDLLDQYLNLIFVRNSPFLLVDCSRGCYMNTTPRRSGKIKIKAGQPSTAKSRRRMLIFPACAASSKYSSHPPFTHKALAPDDSSSSNPEIPLILSDSSLCAFWHARTLLFSAAIYLRLANLEPAMCRLGDSVRLLKSVLVSFDNTAIPEPIPPASVRSSDVKEVYELLDRLLFEIELGRACIGGEVIDRDVIVDTYVKANSLFFHCQKAYIARLRVHNLDRLDRKQ